MLTVLQTHLSSQLISSLFSTHLISHFSFSSPLSTHHSYQSKGSYLLSTHIISHVISLYSSHLLSSLVITRHNSSLHLTHQSFQLATFNSTILSIVTFNSTHHSFNNSSHIISPHVSSHVSSLLTHHLFILNVRRTCSRST